MFLCSAYAVAYSRAVPSISWYWAGSYNWDIHHHMGHPPNWCMKTANPLGEKTTWGSTGHVTVTFLPKILWILDKTVWNLWRLWWHLVYMVRICLQQLEITGSTTELWSWPISRVYHCMFYMTNDLEKISEVQCRGSWKRTSGPV